MAKRDEIIFSIIFKKGMAEKNRLPLAHVIATLRDIDSMIREVGRKVQQEAGVENPTGEFGVELLAGASGLAFLKGSLKTASALTIDPDNGKETISRIIKTTDLIEKSTKKKVVSIDEFRAPIVRGLDSISAYQVKDKTEINIQLIERGRIIERTKFSQRGVNAIQRMNTADFSIEGVTVFGKLRKLLDRSRTDKNDDVWGELIEDNGNKWNIKFLPSDLATAQTLFTKQVMAYGSATYFKTRYPRLDAKQVKEDTPRDYLAALDEFSSDYKDIFKDRDPDEILKDIRG